MTIQTPYNFVPLSAWVFQPEWRALVSQEMPFREGISGRLRYRHTGTQGGRHSFFNQEHFTCTRCFCRFFNGPFFNFRNTNRN